MQTPTFSSTGKPPGTLPWNVTVPNPFYQLNGVSPSASIYTSKTIAVNQLLNPIPGLGGVNENNPVPRASGCRTPETRLRSVATGVTASNSFAPLVNRKLFSGATRNGHQPRDVPHPQ